MGLPSHAPISSFTYVCCSVFGNGKSLFRSNSFLGAEKRARMNLNNEGESKTYLICSDLNTSRII